MHFKIKKRISFGIGTLPLAWQNINHSLPEFPSVWNKIYAFAKPNNLSTKSFESVQFSCNWKVPFPTLIGLFPGACPLLLNLHFLCGIHNCSASVESPTHIIIHLFPRQTHGAFTKGTRRLASIKEFSMCIWKTQLPEKLIRIKKLS